MKFSAAKNQLITALQNVNRAVPTVSPMPILSGILFEVSEDGNLILTGSDSNTMIITTLPTFGHEPGTVVLPAKYVLDIVRKLSGEVAEFEIDEKTWRTSIKSKGSNFQIYGQGGSEFPRPPETTSELAFTVNPAILSNMITSTAFAAGMDGGQPYLSGVCFSISKGLLTTVATNTFRLAKNTGPINLVSSFGDMLQTKLDVIVPADTLNDLVRMLPHDDDVEVTIGDGFAIFKGPDSLIMTRLINDKYLRYEEIIPTDWPITSYIKGKDLLGAAERAEIITRKTNVTRMKLEDDKLIIYASAPDVGEFREAIDAKNEGEDIEVGLEINYLIDALKSIDSEDVVLQFISPSKPISIRAKGRDESQHIVMPMRIY
jgi:DNA polymerase-3 subunit beta